jgi:Flp pilus assembly protein TadD
MFIRSKLSGFVLALAIAPATPGLAVVDCVAPPKLQAKSDHSVQAYTELGTWFGDRKQFACSADAYRSALQLEPRSAKLHYLLGLSLYSSALLKEAVPPLQQSIEIAPDVLKPHLVLAAVLEGLQRQAEAKVEWQTALKIDPGSRVALDGLSRALLSEGKYPDVIRLLSSASRDENLTIHLGQAYIHLKMLDDASKLLTDDLAKNPSSIRLANTLANVQLTQHRYQAAEELCEKTVRLHPADLETQRLYLHALVLTGNTAVSRPLARKLLAGAPHDFEFLYINGILEHDAGEFEAARNHLLEAVALRPSVGSVRFNLGVVLAQLKDAGGAKDQLEKALELGESEPEVHLELAKALNTLGEREQATTQINLYKQGLLEKNNSSIAANNIAQGDKAMNDGDGQRAAAFYRQALTARPDDAQTNFKLAVALDRIGDVAAERSALRKAIELNPDLAPAHNQLGFLASQSGNSSEAEKHFREAVRAAPSFTEAWVNLAATLGLESRFSDAQEAVTSALRLDPKNAQALLLRDTLAKAQAQR